MLKDLEAIQAHLQSAYPFTKSSNLLAKLTAKRVVLEIAVASHSDGGRDYYHTNLARLRNQVAAQDWGAWGMKKRRTVWWRLVGEFAAKIEHRLGLKTDGIENAPPTSTVITVIEAPIGRLPPQRQRWRSIRNKAFPAAHATKRRMPVQQGGADTPPPAEPRRLGVIHLTAGSPLPALGSTKRQKRANRIRAMLRPAVRQMAARQRAVAGRAELRRRVRRLAAPPRRLVRLLRHTALEDPEAPRASPAARSSVRLGGRAAEELWEAGVVARKATEKRTGKAEEKSQVSAWPRLQRQERERLVSEVVSFVKGVHG